MSLVMKLWLTAVGLCLLALVLTPTGLFGDANTLALAMFSGMVVGVPAVLFGFLALLSMTAEPALAVKSVSDPYVREDELLGICPNCSATIPLESMVCPSCRADFGEHSLWRVQRIGKEVEGTLD